MGTMLSRPWISCCVRQDGTPYLHKCGCPSATLFFRQKGGTATMCGFRESAGDTIITPQEDLAGLHQPYFFSKKKIVNFVNRCLDGPLIEIERRARDEDQVCDTTTSITGGQCFGFTPDGATHYTTRITEWTTYTWGWGESDYDPFVGPRFSDADFQDLFADTTTDLEGTVETKSLNAGACEVNVSNQGQPTFTFPGYDAIISPFGVSGNYQIRREIAAVANGTDGYALSVTDYREDQLGQPTHSFTYSGTVRVSRGNSQVRYENEINDGNDPDTDAPYENGVFLSEPDSELAALQALKLTDAYNNETFATAISEYDLRTVAQFAYKEGWYGVLLVGLTIGLTYEGVISRVSGDPPQAEEERSFLITATKPYHIVFGTLAVSEQDFIENGYSLNPFDYAGTVEQVIVPTAQIMPNPNRGEFHSVSSVYVEMKAI